MHLRPGTFQVWVIKGQNIFCALKHGFLLGAAHIPSERYRYIHVHIYMHVHFARRTVYIGSRIPSQHHRRRVFVDRNEIHFDSAEHNVLDEEPLNSAEYAQRSEPFRSDRGLGERREYAYA